MIEILKPVNVNGLPLNRVRLTSNLWLDEYIPYSLYKRYVTPSDKYFGWGDKYLELLCRKIDRNLVTSDQILCDRFGPVTINDWWNNGEANFRGLRTHGCGVGTELSDHYQGKASDKIFRDFGSEEVREYIKKCWKILGITIIEKDVAWVHTSVAWIPDQTELKIVSP
jgi:hypothetical protein